MTPDPIRFEVGDVVLTVTGDELAANDTINFGKKRYNAVLAGNTLTVTIPKDDVLAQAPNDMRVAYQEYQDALQTYQTNDAAATSACDGAVRLSRENATKAADDAAKAAEEAEQAAAKAATAFNDCQSGAPQEVKEAIALDPLLQVNALKAAKAANDQVEPAYKASAQTYETADGAHSVARHGPEISDELLEFRVKHAVTPDYAWSAASASTRFKDYKSFVKSRNAAVAAIQAQNNIDPVAKTIGGVAIPKDQSPISAKVQYKDALGGNAAIDEGVKGTGPPSKVVHPIIGHPSGMTGSPSGKAAPSGDVCYGATIKINGVSGTSTTLQWNPHMQALTPAQHIPLGLDSDWDDVGKTYKNALPVEATI